MINYELNRPDPDAMNLLLSEEWDSASGMIVRLAWYLGLMRGEIRTLSWSQIDFDAAMVRLSDRSVPIPQDMLSYLAGLKSARATTFDYVVVSEKGCRLPSSIFPSLPGRRWTGWDRPLGASDRSAARLRPAAIHRA
jgi:integrase